MPCLNEAATLAPCIERAQEGLRRLGRPGEIVVADNGSTDGSVEIALAHGARVVHVEQRGYGAAYRGGFEAARGRIIVMGDSDDTYDFSRLDELVRGARPGRRPRAGLAAARDDRARRHAVAAPLHRQPAALGHAEPVLPHPHLGHPQRPPRLPSRGLSRTSACEPRGMEFASEMLIAAARAHWRISGESPSRTARAPANRSCGRSTTAGATSGCCSSTARRISSRFPAWRCSSPGRSILRPWWPGRSRSPAACSTSTSCSSAACSRRSAPRCCCSACSPGVPPPRRQWFTLERGLVVGSATLLAGFLVNAVILVRWIATGFGPLFAIRLAIVALTLMVVGRAGAVFVLLSRPVAGRQRRCARSRLPRMARTLPIVAIDTDANWPGVSVLVAARDAAPTLRRCLESLRAVWSTPTSRSS